MIIILAGPVHSGKTTFLQGVFSRWRDRDLRMRGFLSLAFWEGGERRGYDLLELEKGRTLPFLRTSGETDWERIGPFYVIPETLEAARSIILGASPDELLVVDEVGPLELGGGGLWPALDTVLKRPFIKTLLVVREGILDEFLTLLAGHRTVGLDIREKDLEIRLERLVAGAAART
jgi:nucleoside-triphosphatase THEP1